MFTYHLTQLVSLGNQPNNLTSASSQTIDWSKINLLVWPDFKEPPLFRGVQSDEYNIHDWEELMCVFLQRRKYSIPEQTEVILSRVIGL